MSFWSPEGVRAACGGSWLARPVQGAPDLVGASIDSRTIRPGEVYIAIRGDRFDGHDFVRDAVNRGASMVIVEDKSAAAPDRLAGQSGHAAAVRVPSTRSALLRMGKERRRSVEGVRVIAVTGSNGKTTTTRLLDATLASKWRGTASQKSFNNEIGVPLTILALRPGDQYVVCEVGMNAPGEIAPLAEAIMPDVGVITSVGRAHIEAFGSVDGIAHEKASLLRFLAPGGAAVVPADAPLLRPHLKGLATVITFGAAADADLRITEARHAPLTGGGGAGGGVSGGEGATGLRFTLNDRSTFEVPILGLHNAGNAAAAVAVARRLGLSEDLIRQGLRAAKPADMRLQRRLVGGVDLFNDAYNANPESTLAALRTFVDLASAAPRRVLVLGDMRELGEHAPASHSEIAEAILALPHPGVDVVITVGESALHTARRLRAQWPSDRVVTFSDADAGPTGGARAIAALLRPGDAALLKGSRGVGLERIEQALAASASTLHGTAPALR